MDIRCGGSTSGDSSFSLLAAGKHALTILKKVDYENGKRKCEREEVVMVDQEVYYPPELGAQVFWLKNRKPDKWREKVENKIETEEDGVGVMILTPVKEAEDE